MAAEDHSYLQGFPSAEAEPAAEPDVADVDAAVGDAVVVSSVDTSCTAIASAINLLIGGA